MSDATTKSIFGGLAYDDFITTKSIFRRLACAVPKEPVDCSFYSSIVDSKIVDEFLQDSNTQAVGVVRFEDFNLSPELMKGLYEGMKFVRPTKIQSMSLPIILTPPYKHLIVQATICSGMTTCSVLGMLSRVDPTLAATQALCICPTRELAIQIMEMLLKMRRFTGITSDLVLPADRAKASYIPASSRATVTAQVVVSTPGTAFQLIEAEKLGTSNLKVIVFEGADRMLIEGGFKKVAVRIMKEIVTWSPKCQVLLFSATSNDTVEAFVSTFENDLFVQDFHHLLVKKEDLSLDSFKQYKVNLLDELSKIMVVRDKILGLGDGVWQTIIYVRARKSAGMLHEALAKHGYAVTTIKGALAPKDRDKIFKEFKDGLTRILISADFLERGFDQSQVNLVVNYDLPVNCDYRTEPDYEAYLHHIGRAGRFGRKGAVFNLLCGDTDSMIMEKIERRFNRNVTEVPLWTSDDDFKDALKKAGLM